MANELIGLDANFGWVKEVSWGTAVALGAGNRFQPHAGVKVTDGLGFAVDDKVLGTGPTRRLRTLSQARMNIPVMPLYEGLDLPFALLFDSLIARTQASSYRSSYRREFELLSQPAHSMTLAYAVDTDVFVSELAGGMPQGFTLSAADGGEAEAILDILTNTPTIEGTNGAAQIAALTFALDPVYWDYMHFDHSKLWIARSDEDLAVMQLGKWSLNIQRGLSEDNRATKSSAGIIHVQPRRTAHPNIILNVTPKEQNTDWWGSLYEDPRARAKAILELIGDRGAPGCMYGGANPPVDITGTGNGSMGINIDGDGAQQITITVAGLNSGALIAAYIQARIRLLTANDPSNQSALDNATCTYVGAPATDYYKITSGDRKGDSGSVVVTAGATGTDYGTALELTVGAGGTGVAGESNRLMMFLPELVMVAGEPRNVNDIGRITSDMQLRAVQLITSAPSGFTNGDQEYLTTDCIRPRLVLVNQLAVGALDP